MTNQTKDERIKLQIREAARGLFQKWGFQKTTMEDIAKAARKGKSTLYYYFKSKDDIFEEIVSEEFHAIFTKAQAAMERQTTAEGKLRAYLLCTVEEAKQRVTVYEVAFGEISDYETIINTLRKTQEDQERAVIREILADGVQSGELKLLDDRDIDRLASILLLIFKALMFEYFLKSKFNEVTEMISLVTTVFMAGLKS